jgi:hypothetical protein
MTASRLARVLFAAAIGVGGVQVAAQQAKPATATTPRAAARIDFTGYWVSYVTEDWRFRMITPPKGDYRAVPLTAEGRKTADAWDPAADARTGNECKAYGAAAIMRVPGRFHITWQDDNTLRVEADTGQQTRLFQFGPATASTARTWQGSSKATWDRLGRSLTVVTTNMRAGYLRRNGVPYSEDATVTEYFDLAPHPGGGQMLIVTTVVEDPRYLQRSFVISSQFKKELDGSKWNPTPCTATW